MKCQQTHSVQLAVKILYGFLALLIIAVAVLATLGKNEFCCCCFCFPHSLKLHQSEQTKLRFSLHFTTDYILYN